MAPSSGVETKFNADAQGQSFTNPMTSFLHLWRFFGSDVQFRP